MKLDKAKAHFYLSKSGLNKKEVAERTNLSYSATVSAFKGNRCLPVTAYAIAKAIGSSVDDLKEK